MHTSTTAVNNNTHTHKFHCSRCYNYPHYYNYHISAS